jgi:two-component system KDP operon response regulator KdpE
MSDNPIPNIQHEILVVEDDSEIRRFVRTTLTAEQYRVREAASAAEGLRESKHRPPDAILLDLGLPDADGVDVIRQIREWSHNLPIIVLSVRSHERDKIRALDAGADDYVNKPFAVGELLARLRAALRRSLGAQGETSSGIFRFGDIEVDMVRRRVAVAGQEVHLTRIEYKLLQVMIHHADRVLTHSQLLNDVWGPNQQDQAHYVRVYMTQLRRKLESDPARPKHLRTEPGVGYRLSTV